jgi:hypothetical protein
VKKFFTFLGISLFAFLLAVFSLSNQPNVQESITFFPIDPNVKFKVINTSLNLNHGSTVLWKIESTLDRKAYLRQDAGFLYANGKLMGELHGWKQNTQSLLQEKQIKTENNTHYEAITFHHAELHENAGQIFSSQAMSLAQLYVIISSNQAPFSFRFPKTKEQSDWKQKLDEQTQRMLNFSWNKGLRHFSINLSEYKKYPLNLFDSQAKIGFPGFTKGETDRIEGNLWEGLYKNYLLGIKKADGTTVSPIGSTMPLILLANDKTHLLVLTETANGEPILLRQMIEGID